MLETSSPSASHLPAYAPVAPRGRHRRGTPAYAAAVRRQIARLAAQHAAQVALLPPAPPPVTATVVVEVGCPRARHVICEGLAAIPWLQVVETYPPAAPVGDVGELPPLRLVDRLPDRRGGMDVPTADLARTVLLVDTVPRGGSLPPALAGVLALPLNPDRVGRYVRDLLDRLDGAGRSDRVQP